MDVASAPGSWPRWTILAFVERDGSLVVRKHHCSALSVHLILLDLISRSRKFEMRYPVPNKVRPFLLQDKLFCVLCHWCVKP